MAPINPGRVRSGSRYGQHGGATGAERELEQVTELVAAFSARLGCYLSMSPAVVRDALLSARNASDFTQLLLGVRTLEGIRPGQDLHWRVPATPWHATGAFGQALAAPWPQCQAKYHSSSKEYECKRASALQHEAARHPSASPITAFRPRNMPLRPTLD
jgi:hypothetical protein